MQDILNSVPQKDLYETQTRLLEKIESLKHLRGIVSL